MNTDMKILWRRITASTLVRKLASLGGRNQPPSPTGLHVRLEHKMQHLSTDRQQWIEGRLFTLARVLHKLRAEGLRTATGHQMANDGHGASLLVNAAIEQVQTERLVLMAERAVVQEYLTENGEGS